MHPKDNPDAPHHLIGNLKYSHASSHQSPTLQQCRCSPHSITPHPSTLSSSLPPFNNPLQLIVPLPPSSNGQIQTSMSSNKLGELIASKWRGLASKESWRKKSKGHFVFYAKGGKRFLVPLKYLDHPIFRVLLEVAEEEFGNVACGPLRVPCEEELIDHLVSLID
ncbi:hypothetical protein M5K25_017491 [Dendrobium thyrsiflorum]|uniref:Uncharacterized protein n=1 Tax=Dendrobium thyrsiflorum TaxID=117978 RepID=A0ABD0UMX6_DENTH